MIKVSIITQEIYFLIVNGYERYKEQMTFMQNKIYRENCE